MRSPPQRYSDRRGSQRPSGLALGIFYAGADEDDVRSVGEMRHERLCQLERAEMVRRECHVPAQRVLRCAHLPDARIVEQAGDREMERDDLRGRTPHARKIGQVAHDRYRVLALLLDDFCTSASFPGRGQPGRPCRAWLARMPYSALCRKSGR